MNFHAKSGVCSSKIGRVIALGKKEDIWGGSGGGGGGAHFLQWIIQSKKSITYHLKWNNYTKQYTFYSLKIVSSRKCLKTQTIFFG